MKNKIIFLLSVALLLTSLNAFAEKMTSQKTTIMNNTSVNSNIKTSLQNVYEENKAKEASPEDEIKEICKNDKYCLEAGSFLLFTLNTMGEDAPNDLLEDMFEGLKSTKNYKQKLYEVKYASSINSLRYYLIKYEDSKLEKLTKFDEIKEYILDMPIPYPSFIKAIKKMKATARSKEELDFVDSFMNKYTGKLFPKDYEEFKEEAILELTKDSNPFCPESLIVDNYGYDNLCILPFQFTIKDYSKDGLIKIFKRIDIEKFTKDRPVYVPVPKYKKMTIPEKEEDEEMIFAYFE